MSDCQQIIWFEFQVVLRKFCCTDERSPAKAQTRHTRTQDHFVGNLRNICYGSATLVDDDHRKIPIANEPMCQQTNKAASWLLDRISHDHHEEMNKIQFGLSSEVIMLKPNMVTTASYHKLEKCPFQND